jgi:small subunit ribosomal protein S6|tara:strand:- start:72063 stop:72566 length:504 start_codon:yes stop_codon:yes gene_type:complete
MTTETMARTGTYEGMFLVSQAAASQFGDTLTHINELFGRANATVVAMKKWDDRRLAYEIDKQKRGVYILAYFTCPTDMVGRLERDAQISSKILRLLVIKADHLTDEEIAAHDERRALADEAKLRAERAESEEDESSGRVRLGAPEQQAPAEPEAAEDSAADESSDEN